MIYVASLVLAVNFVFCTGDQQPQQKPDTTNVKKKMTITEVLAKHTDEWLKVPGVIGTGEGESDGKPAIIVFVETKTKTIEEKIPKTVDGFNVVIEVTGEIIPLQ